LGQGHPGARQGEGIRDWIWLRLILNTILPAKEGVVNSPAEDSSPAAAAR